jgi:hypothetical protein
MFLELKAHFELLEDRTGLRGWTAKQLPKVLRYNQKNWKYGGSNLRFPQKELLCKLSAIWACALKNSSPALS